MAFLWWPKRREMMKTRVLKFRIWSLVIWFSLLSSHPFPSFLLKSFRDALVSSISYRQKLVHRSADSASDYLVRRQLGRPMAVSKSRSARPGKVARARLAKEHHLILSDCRALKKHASSFHLQPVLTTDGTVFGRSFFEWIGQWDSGWSLLLLWWQRMLLYQSIYFYSQVTAADAIRLDDRSNTLDNYGQQPFFSMHSYH
jgi:hypothetical protein